MQAEHKFVEGEALQTQPFATISPTELPLEPLAWSKEGTLSLVPPLEEEPEEPAPPAPRKPRPPRQQFEISPKDAELLEWFYTVGRSTFCRSLSGAIIERLQMFSFGSEECPKCNGTGFRGGWSYGEECKESTDGEKLLALIVEQSKDKKKYAKADACCAVCRGSGVQMRTTRSRAKEAVTVQPKTQQSQGAGYMPTDFALQHYAIACRRLDIVHQKHHKSGIFLETFHGDWGGRWADTDNGRLFSLYCFTAAGHKLIRMSREKGSVESKELPPHEVIGTEYTLQLAQPNDIRRDLFNAAREQAQRLLTNAWRVWNESEPASAKWRDDREDMLEKRIRDSRITEILSGAGVNVVKRPAFELVPEFKNAMTALVRARALSIRGQE